MEDDEPGSTGAAAIQAVAMLRGVQANQAGAKRS